MTEKAPPSLTKGHTMQDTHAFLMFRLSALIGKQGRDVPVRIGPEECAPPTDVSSDGFHWALMDPRGLTTPNGEHTQEGVV